MDDSPFNRLLHRAVVLGIAFFLATSLGTIALTAVAEAARDLVGKGIRHAFPVADNTGAAGKVAPGLQTVRVKSIGIAENTGNRLALNEITRAAVPPALGVTVNPPVLTQDEVNAPEPATLSLLLLGGLAATAVRKRPGRAARSEM